MAYLTIGGATVPVDEEAGARVQRIRIGDQGRAEDGTLLSTVRAWKAVAHVITRPIPRVTADAVLAVLQGTPPVAVAGDWLGAMDAHVGQIDESTFQLAEGEHVILTFDLQEQ